MFLLETTSGTAVGTHFMQITVLKSSGTENTKIQQKITGFSPGQPSLRSSSTGLDYDFQKTSLDVDAVERTLYGCTIFKYSMLL